MVKVCHISTVHKPLDGRVFFKECQSLVSGGFDVSFVVSHSKKEVISGVQIVPLPENDSRLYRILIKTWIALFKALGTKSKIYHFHDPELILVGICLKIFGKKVIYDMHELVYHQIVDKNWIGAKWVRKMVAGFYRGVEGVGIRLFDKIILAEVGYQDYFNENYPKRLGKVEIIQNFPIIDLIEKSVAKERSPEITRLIYAGGLTKIRGIGEMCQAVEKVKTPVELILLGPWESEVFKAECLGYSSKVNYLGSLPLNEIFPIVKSADIGLALLHPVKNYTTTLLTKGYEYMACELPILMSDFPVWEAFFHPYSLFVNPLDVNAIVEKLEWMIENIEDIQIMGAKGVEAARTKYCWEVESEKLIEIYKSIL